MEDHLEQKFDFCEARESFLERLQEAHSQNDVTCLKDAVQNSPGSDSEKKIAVDQVFRDFLHQLKVDDHQCSDLTSVVDLAIAAVQAELSSPSTPFLLLGDIFDSVTISVCGEVFKFVEDKVAVWNSTAFYTSGKNFLLRMSNDLLRRLSKSQDTVFCGRIQLFLAKFFPLDEKSGVNLMSNFNLENVTTYNKDNLEGLIQQQPEEKEESMETEEGEMTDGNVRVDYQLYRKFWSLQDYFRNPTQCYVKEKWKIFMKNADSVLDAFSSMKLEDVQNVKENDAGHKRNDFFVKYLTSEKLFDLQLSDSTFRRYVLVQFLILFQYLNQKVKFKAGQMALTDEMVLYLSDTTTKVYELLKEIPPKGEEFAKCISHILDREEHWNSWKNEGCPSFVKEKPKAEQEPKRRPRKRTLGEELMLNSESKRIDMGSTELTRLWNLCPDNLEACRSKDRVFIPSLEEFFEDAIDQADPAAMVEEQYKVIYNSNFAWQALRLLARRSPHFFQTTTTMNHALKTIPAYLEFMASKLAKEMPRTAHVPPKSSPYPSKNSYLAFYQFNNGDEQLKTEEENDEDNDELLQSGEEEKQAKVTQEELDLVGTKLGINWKVLAGELSFTEDEISTIQTDHPELKEQVKHLLAAWHEREDSTRDGLIKALTESGLKDIVQSVFLKRQNGTEKAS